MAPTPSEQDGTRKLAPSKSPSPVPDLQTKERTWSPGISKEDHRSNGSDSRQEQEPFPLRQAIGSSSISPVFPKPGDEILGFTLLEELGRGSFARVFLARQGYLAGRPVVLKISAITGNEPWMLAQLQHTNIVPIYSLHQDASRGLRVVCMPYFRGGSFDKVRDRLPGPSMPLQGGQLLQAVEMSSAVRSALTGELGSTSDMFFPEEQVAPWKEETYVRSVVWLIARCAEGLQHAHERGVLHRDIKPSNILLLTDGRPMLLDFDVSVPLVDGHPEEGVSSAGTVSYMSPEQLRAMIHRDEATMQHVDCRSDIYSLGMVLYELLIGKKPFPVEDDREDFQDLLRAVESRRSKQCPSLKKARPELPWSLESIVRRCLAPNPDHRYRQAAELAEDCQRFLDYRPLRHAPELSYIERAQKWVHRHPRLVWSMGLGSLITLILILMLQALTGAQRNLKNTKEALASAQLQEKIRAHRQGSIETICLLSTFIDGQDHLEKGRRLARETLNLFSVLENPEWQSLQDWQRLQPEERRQVAESTWELLLLMAHDAIRQNGNEKKALEEALSLLDRAARIPGSTSSPVLWRARAEHLSKLGRNEEAQKARKRAAELPPRNARDHYLLATTYAQQGKYDQSIQQLNTALQLNPHHYWSALQRGICHQEQGNNHLALADFGICIGLWPDHAWAFFNRGYILAKMGSTSEAIRAYSDAIERDNSLRPAYWNRALLYLKKNAFPEAWEDLQYLLKEQKQEATLLVMSGVALEGLKQFGKADQHFQQAMAQLEQEEEKTRLHCLVTYAFAIFKRKAPAARKSFEQVLKSDPQHAQALYGMAMLLVEEGREQDSLAFFTRAIQADAKLTEARRYRAIVHARLGDLTAAVKDVNWCLSRSSHSGPALYAAACVSSLAVTHLKKPAEKEAAKRLALQWLQKALKKGHGHKLVQTDPDLANLRKEPLFQKWLAIQSAETARTD